MDINDSDHTRELARQLQQKDKEIFKLKDDIAKLEDDIARLHKENEQIQNNYASERDALKKENKQLRQHLTVLTDLQQQVNPPEVHVSTPTEFTWPVLEMTNFQQHKNISEGPSGDIWYSPPFFTHNQGYKICLAVRANGFHGALGTHVTVCVRLIGGEFDDSLNWPLQGVISFKLIDRQGTNAHHKFDVVYDHTTDDGLCGRMPRGERAEHGWGPVKFIAHSELVPKYLHNDTLQFQMHKFLLFRPC